MSAVLKKEDADKLVFKHNPKFIRGQTSDSAKSFVKMQNQKGSDFVIAEVVSQQAGITALKAKHLEDQVEETVLERLKEIQEKAYKGAYDLGLVDGNEKAFQEKQQELTSRVEKLVLLCQTMETYLETISKQSEIILMKVLFKIAERLAMRTIELDQEPIVELLKSIVQELQSAQHILVQINPGDLKFIEELKAKNDLHFDILKRVKFEANDQVLSGGCLVETDFGTVDASIEQRVEKAWQAIESKLPILKKDNPPPMST
jgi:flagellar assembly protein FliH